MHLAQKFEYMWKFSAVSDPNKIPISIKILVRKLGQCRFNIKNWHSLKKSHSSLVWSLKESLKFEF